MKAREVITGAHCNQTFQNECITGHPTDHIIEKNLIADFIVFLNSHFLLNEFDIATNLKNRKSSLDKNHKRIQEEKYRMNY